MTKMTKVTKVKESCQLYKKPERSDTTILVTLVIRNFRHLKK